VLLFLIHPISTIERRNIMTTVATATNISPPSPVIERRPRSSSFGSTTPTYSQDVAKLKSACPTSTIVSVEKAIAIASTFDVLGSNSPLSRKISLTSESDWISFMKSLSAITVEEEGEKINLTKLLRNLYDTAYKMPPSPSTKHVRAASGTVPNVSLPPMNK